MEQVETTLTLSRFDTYERLDDEVNRFILNHNIIEIKPFSFDDNKGDWDVGYQIIYET